MTLIATLKMEGYIGLIGDLLISNNDIDPHKIKIHLDTPTIQNINSVLKNGEISALAQKLALINNRIAIGWAGNFKDARSVIKNIYDAEMSSKLSYSDLMGILKSYGKGQDRFYLIGIITKFIDGEIINVNYFGWDSHKGLIHPKEEGKFLKTLYRFGSGSEDLIDMVDRAIGAKKGESTSIGSGFILGTVGLMGNLIGEQLRHHSGVDLLYGGGYEGIVFRNTEMKKIDKILFVNLEIKKISNKFEISFFPFIKVLYQNDVLKIVRYEIQNSSTNGGEFEGETKFFYMEPIYRTLNHDEISQLIFDHLNYEISNLSIHLPQINETFNRALYNQDQNAHYLILEEETNKFKVLLTDKFGKEVMPKVEELLANL